MAVIRIKQNLASIAEIEDIEIRSLEGLVPLEVVKGNRIVFSGGQDEYLICDMDIIVEVVEYQQDLHP
ncbi:hypothetical protein PENSUB_10358 [Penicillium subrubescens]|uniref:Uncharacterized protein n=1 Tax=Penicillium subrubescens TaxID=1316194 RepID=A0A1Q5TBE3_9EURO|nr:hypothetical protein PENSUB_10358 [Penicillium subrubescens]